MDPLAWILIGGSAMSAIAMVGGLTALLPREILERLVLPMVALAAGTLFGGALFHRIPEGSAALDPLHAGAWLAGGFTTFLALEQFLHWHHSHRAGEGPAARKPSAYLVLVGDGVHNFFGGLGVASTFLIDPRAGVVAWLAAAAHEVPQELGDFGVLVHGGFPRRRAVLWNLLSALTFPLGAVLAYASARLFEVSGLVLFGAGNFIYIAASDLIPEIKAQPNWRAALLHFLLFGGGLLLLFALAGGGPGSSAA